MKQVGVGRRPSPSSPILPHHSSSHKKLARARFLRIPSKRSLLRLLLLFAVLALAPPLYFHFRLRRFQQVPMDAYRVAIDSRVDCIEIDVSRSSDGVLFAVHDRCVFPSLAWSQSQTQFLLLFQVGYIVMSDPSTGARSKLLRMKGAAVVGVYHPLVDEELVRILHGYQTLEGKKVYAWTVDDAESMQRMLFEHVDAIITSNPSLLQGIMQDMKTECLQDGFP
ncbi:hypothetical protein GW17_00003819 [Ensete ventricosum]|nr:hypothetical protein GW17_00003819 [Ensete ventricosum]